MRRRRARTQRDPTTTPVASGNRDDFVYSSSREKYALFLSRRSHATRRPAREDVNSEDIRQSSREVCYVATSPRVFLRSTRVTSLIYILLAKSDEWRTVEDMIILSFLSCAVSNFYPIFAPSLQLRYGTRALGMFHKKINRNCVEQHFFCGLGNFRENSSQIGVRLTRSCLHSISTWETSLPIHVGA